MTNNEVAKRYARALYMIEKESGPVSKAFEQLSSVATAITQNKEAQDFICSPLFTNDQKLTALKAAAGKEMSESISNLLSVLGEKKRLTLISDIAGAYEQILDEEKGVVKGEVRSATNIPASEQTKIEQAIGEIVRKKVVLNFKQDSRVVGGTVAQVGGWMFDDSLQSHLTRLKEDLNRRSN